MDAAREVLETVDIMVREKGSMFHAFWWTHYVTFCALSVIYVWDLQQRRLGRIMSSGCQASLLKLAEKCQRHLANATATNSLSHRYAIILERFRTASLSQFLKSNAFHTPRKDLILSIQDDRTPEMEDVMTPTSNGDLASELNSVDPSLAQNACTLDTWQMTDWLDQNCLVSSSIVSPAELYE